MARYIDADAVIAKIKAEHCDKCKHENCFYCDFDKALLLLEEADDADAYTVDITPNYCPNCGAKMDERKGE